MSQPGLSFLVQQLAYQAAPVLVYVIGVIVGLTFLARHPGAASLTVAACGLMLLATTAMMGIQAYVIQMQASQGWSGTQFASVMGIAGIVGSLVRAVATAMLLAAVFVGRRPAVSNKPFKEPF